ncbi:MAG: undecaprenyldiphospho-muramoylpentapeptide beta-N-acetylglucosaminyltransferase [Gammaproteobacteria bacterium]
MAARVMVMAGGTGGHVFPALAVADELRARGCEVSWLGTPNSFEARVVPQYGFPVYWVDAYRLRGQSVLGLVLAPLRLARAMLQAWRAIRRLRPQVVLGMGGFVTGPGGLVAWLTGRPLVVHEQNAVPGLTNQWLARFATRVLEAFPGSFAAARGAELTGNPVRREIAELPPPAERLAGRGGPCRVLVLGGSLGAAALNETVPEAVGLLAPDRRPAIRHQAGRDKVGSARRAYAAAGVRAEVSDFVQDMAEAYGWADLVICRAGALTLSELAAAGVGALLVPYPNAVDDHQTRNAEHLVGAGAARLLPQATLGARELAATLRELCTDRAALRAMAEAARRLARPHAARHVADVCEEVAA